MKKSFSPSSIFWILGGLVLLLAFGRLFISFPAKKLPVLGQSGEFNLTERSGKKVTLRDLSGKVWIGDFIFTRCAGICPLMSGHMRRLQEALKGSQDLRFVSFSVDPEYDTPEKLSAYAQKFGADPEKWLFLTGDKKELFELSLKHFHLGVGDAPPEERTDPDQVVTHSTRFVLVDREGFIRGYYDSAQVKNMDKLVLDAKRLLKE